MLGLVRVVIVPTSVVATLPIVLAVLVLKTTATTSTIGACAHRFGGLMGPIGASAVTILIWCFPLNFLLLLWKARAYGKGLLYENQRLTHVAAAQFYLGTITFLVLVATHILVMVTLVVPANLFLDVCPTTSIFITTILATSIKLYTYGCIFVAIGSAIVGFIATTPSTFKR